MAKNLNSLELCNFFELGVYLDIDFIDTCSFWENFTLGVLIVGTLNPRLLLPSEVSLATNHILVRLIL